MANPGRLIYAVAFCHQCFFIFVHAVKDADVARLSPLLHEHINMVGRYSFSVPDAVAMGELRP